ncbi:MAG: apolipoprotein N-acyltransferase [Roseivirga sp.]
MHSVIAGLGNLQQHRFYLVFLSLVSTLCFWLAWPPHLCAPLLFVAFIPLLMMEQHIAEQEHSKPGWTFYKYAYLTLFLWNLSTTWWVADAALAGAVFMFLINPLCISLPLALFYFTNKHLGRGMGYLSLVTYWVSMEYAHLQWELSFPWLNLGNGFARWPAWVQWYEYTGALGGTIWVIVANLFLYQGWMSTKVLWRPRWRGIAALWILLPMLYSYYTYVHYKEQGEEVEAVVMQPNIYPRTGEFVSTQEILPMEKRVERFITLSEAQLTAQTQCLVWPEAAIDLLFDEQRLGDYVLIDRLVEFRRAYPQLSIVAGLNSAVSYEDKKATKTARFSERRGYYDVFNTALFVDNQGSLGTYHKSKLVPGAETIPYLYSVNLPAALTAGYGTSLRSMGTQDHPSVFFNAQGLGVAPVICYESVYGDHVARFIRQGASLLCAITIDGWWNKTPGHLQHFHYVRLRAIECRRSIARSALQGISGFINQRGDILQATQYEDEVALRHTLQANTVLTFYARYGDYYLAQGALWGSLLLLVTALSQKFMTYRKRKEMAAGEQDKG